MAISQHSRILFSLTALAAGKGHAQDALRYRFQYYSEEDDRMDVVSHYLDYERVFSTNTTLGLRLAIDSLSGQTPLGVHAPLDEDTLLLQEIDDERRVATISLEQEIDDYTLSFEYTRSEEEDYESNSVALKFGVDFFEKNTSLSAGVSYADDTVLQTPFTNIQSDESKTALDFSLGLSQILGPNTVLDLNVGYGRSKGYLADPYRQISETKTVLVDTPVGVFPVTDTFNFPENRPDELDRWVAKITARHYIPSLNAALEGSYRFFANSDDVVGHTFELRWAQEVTDSLNITPFFRYYRQSEAEYYYPNLTNSGVSGHDRNDGEAPFYSSDYRLSALESFTYGINFSYEVIDDLTLDLQLERYEMSGRDSTTSSSLYPSANVISAGLQWKF